MKTKEILKGKIVFARVTAELFKILDRAFKRNGKKNPLKIGDIVAIDEYGCRLSNIEEVNKIPKEKIISYDIDQGYEGIIVQK